MSASQPTALLLKAPRELAFEPLELICSQISGVGPAISHRWNKLRLWQTAVRLQYEKRLNLLPLITHTVPFVDAPALFARIDAGEPGMLQSVLTFGASV